MTLKEPLQQIAAEVAACTLCALHQSRKRSVPGEGPAAAQVMFIGEGPGFHENEQGRPFVGAAGQFLDDLLASIGFKRSEVFITNVVKCRPPNNRDPEPDELSACAAYLDRQIAAINPQIIITLGRFSMARYFPNAKISAIHGQARLINGRIVIAMFHPAAGLHQGSLRPVIEKDFAQIPALIARLAAAQAKETPAAAPPEPEKPKQLSLF